MMERIYASSQGVIGRDCVLGAQLLQKDDTATGASQESSGATWLDCV
jgi:hypothetical protein